jgi:hypothetical protein
LIRLTGRGCGTLKSIKKVLLEKVEAPAPGQPKPESFSDIKDVDMVAHKTDIVGDSGLLPHPNWNKPGASKGENGELVKPAGWSLSVADTIDYVKVVLHICATVDMIAEGGATCESIARTAQEVFDRAPKLVGTEGRVLRTIIVVWCAK